MSDKPALATFRSVETLCPSCLANDRTHNRVKETPRCPECLVPVIMLMSVPPS